MVYGVDVYGVYRDRRAAWTLGLVAVTTFMLVIDLTVVTVALGSIQAELNASLAALQWVIDAYAIALAVLLLAAATLGDRIGRRRVFLFGVAVFTLASLACGLAPTAGALDVARAVRGAGAAALLGTGTPAARRRVPAGREPQPRPGRLRRRGGQRGGDRAAGRRRAHRRVRLARGVPGQSADRSVRPGRRRAAPAGDARSARAAHRLARHGAGQRRAA